MYQTLSIKSPHYGLQWTNPHDYCAKRGYAVPFLVLRFAPTRLIRRESIKLIRRWGVYAGTDASQGRGQIISNINACLAVQDTVKTTLGPYGGDLLLVDANGRQTITNDGATVMKVCTHTRVPSTVLHLTHRAFVYSYLTSFILLLGYLQISRVRKTPKLVMGPRPLLC